MHERRNFVLSLLLAGGLIWAFVAWLIAPDFWPGIQPSILFHRLAATAAILTFGAVLIYAYWFEDGLKDDLARVAVGHYFEQDGLCFMPLTRVTTTKRGPQAEISLYYQNRYSNPCEAVIHLRPPSGSFASHRGARDVHFAFRCDPGAFGVVHQPIAVPAKSQGEVIPVQLAAAVRWPRGHGDKLRSRCGQAAGTFDVDWALAYRQSVHELGGDIELKAPAVVHLALPRDVRTEIGRGEFTNEVIAAAG